MTYLEFINIMQGKVKEKLGADVAVNVHETTKNNGVIRVGLLFLRVKANVSPTIYLEEFYEQYLHGKTMEELAQSICAVYEKVKENPSFSNTSIFEYPRIKERIVYKVIRRETNEELLAQVPHELFLDLAVVYYAIWETSGMGAATLLIKNEHLHDWNVRKEEIAEAAKRNTLKLLNLEVMKFTEFMYILTNRTKNLGAAVILYEDVLEQMADMLGENYYVLPSSVHEVIVVPESFGMNRAQLRQMVQEVNQNEVEAEEILSDHVYYYDKSQSRLTDQ